MPSSSSESTRARRALIEEIKEDKKLATPWSGSADCLGSRAWRRWIDGPDRCRTAHHLDRNGGDERAPQETSRGAERSRLDFAKVKSLADQRAEELSKIDSEVSEASMDESAKARDKALEAISNATRRGDTDQTRPGKPERQPATRRQRQLRWQGLLVASGYRIAARFHQVGPGALSHRLGLLLPVGTPLRAPAAGVVTTAGIGSASGWAGNYVAIKHPDGTHTLMAHMSTVSVRVGQTVSACQVVGTIGMTGRTFGAHVHFEVYPAGVSPGDI